MGLIKHQSTIDSKQKTKHLKSKEIHRLDIPVFTRAFILERSLWFCIMGVSFKSTSLRFPLDLFDAERPANSEVVSACAISMASFASLGKNNRANATVKFNNKSKS